MSLLKRSKNVLDWLIFIAIAPLYVIDAWQRRLDKWM